MTENVISMSLADSESIAFAPAYHTFFEIKASVYNQNLPLMHSG